MNAETKVLNRSDYYGTVVKDFIQIVHSEINPDAVQLDLTLALTEEVLPNDATREFDFVYFANSIDKAADLAIEAFALCKEKYPDITLHIIGGYSKEYKDFLDERIKELGIGNNVVFEGLLPTHDEVVSRIRHSRFALLPLKSDIISGTIRESMAAGLPVLTTITSGTPSLNEEFQSVLLSPIGNHRALADNMCKVLGDDELVQSLIDNAYKIAARRESNYNIMNDWRKAYHSCVIEK